VKALQKFVETEDGRNLLAGYRRAANILKKEGVDLSAATARHAGPVPGSTAQHSASPADGWTPEQVRGDDKGSQTGAPAPITGSHSGAFAFAYAPEPAEAALAEALARQIPVAEAAIEAEQFEAAMTALSVIRPAIDRFFDDVTVNSQDDTQRSTRLSLLAHLYAAMQKIADFSKIEG
jgi:glycyl-tRNA synthetase beta chain